MFCSWYTMLKIALFFILLISSTAYADCIKILDFEICTDGDIQKEKIGGNTNYFFTPTFWQELFDGKEAEKQRGVIRIMRFPTTEKLKQEFKELSTLGTVYEVGDQRYVKGILYGDTHLFFAEFSDELMLLYVNSGEKSFVDNAIKKAMGKER